MRKLLVAVLATLMALAPMAMADPVGFDVDVEKYITATFNYANVDFANLAAGSSDTAATGQAGGKFNVTVGTNFAYKVSALGTNFVSIPPGYAFDIGNLKMAVSAYLEDLTLGNAKALTGGSQDIGAGQVNPISFHGYWLSIPEGLHAGPYNSTVTVTYANE